MKLLLLLIFTLFPLGSRPTNEWVIASVPAEFANGKRVSVIIIAQTPEDALQEFHERFPTREVRSLSRLSFETCMGHRNDETQ